MKDKTIKYHIMIKDADGEWDYFFKKKDFKSLKKGVLTRNDLAQNDQFCARENAKQISRRKGIGEVGIYYDGGVVDIFVNGKMIKGKEIVNEIKPIKGGGI